MRVSRTYEAPHRSSIIDLFLITRELLGGASRNTRSWTTCLSLATTYLTLSLSEPTPPTPFVFALQIGETSRRKGDILITTFVAT
ncbi:hypothetical protein BDM02DRAFT_2279810 [Thelephora ganbajun]|uniref:Uncharacterized protein n=1 Tax=Thelephora ganbajun TaxID=370292 RepID=A0ACB6ZET8_THEGA|nr:hypothetical protein BDM02DRAFT_2279810 [Thelephora ganbajun]